MTKDNLAPSLPASVPSQPASSALGWPSGLATLGPPVSLLLWLASLPHDPTWAQQMDLSLLAQELSCSPPFTLADRPLHEHFLTATHPLMLSILFLYFLCSVW